VNISIRPPQKRKGTPLRFPVLSCSSNKNCDLILAKSGRDGYLLVMLDPEHPQLGRRILEDLLDNGGVGS
jgi:hypothetical protein